jgi:hypothetical protein
MSWNSLNSMKEIIQSTQYQPIKISPILKKSMDLLHKMVSICLYLFRKIIKIKMRKKKLKIKMKKKKKILLKKKKLV